MRYRLNDFAALSFWVSSKEEAVDFVVSEIKSGRSVFVVTLTAEMILYGTKNFVAGEAISNATMVLADSIAVTLWLRFIQKKRVFRITGVDFSEALLKRAMHDTLSVGLIGGKNSIVNERAATAIRAKGVVVSFNERGPAINSFFKNIDIQKSFNRIILAQPQIIFVGFGHGKQEWWISEILPTLRVPTVLIGVGGTIDLWGGAAKRAPKFLCVHGFEWLWRLIHEPTRIKRILTALVVFPVRAFIDFLVYSPHD